MATRHAGEGVHQRGVQKDQRRRHDGSLLTNDEDEFGSVSREAQMRPHVTQVKPPAVGLLPALRRDRFFSY